MSEGLRLKPHFLSAWLRNPLQMGAVLPSSGGLATAMAAQVDRHARLVVELGAGTGAVTAALFARGIQPGHLVAIEKDPQLARELARRFPGLDVRVGDAARLRALLRHTETQPVDFVVSSLPLLSLRQLSRTRILSQIFSLLKHDGRLVQFTYSPRPPIPVSLADALDLVGTRVERVFLNVPPASVWVYQRQRRTAAS